jgi:hypothetical protein
MLLRQKLNRVIVARRLIESAIGYLFRRVFDDALANNFSFARKLSAEVGSYFRAIAASDGAVVGATLRQEGRRSQLAAGRMLGPSAEKL